MGNGQRLVSDIANWASEARSGCASWRQTSRRGHSQGCREEAFAARDQDGEKDLREAEQERRSIQMPLMAHRCNRSGAAIHSLSERADMQRAALETGFMSSAPVPLARAIRQWDAFESSSVALGQPAMSALAWGSCLGSICSQASASFSQDILSATPCIRFGRGCAAGCCAHERPLWKEHCGYPGELL
jgi:hypothetical protein